MPSMQKTSQACQRDQFLVFITSMLFISDNSHSLLICTLISENQGLEKSRSVSNPSRFAEPEICLGFEIDIDFSRPLFSEIGVQIKRPTVGWNCDIQPQETQSLIFDGNLWRLENKVACSTELRVPQILLGTNLRSRQEKLNAECPPKLPSSAVKTSLSGQDEKRC